MARGEGTVVVRVVGEVRDAVAKIRNIGNEVGEFATRSRNVITESFSDITSVITSRFGRVGQEAQKTLDGIAKKAAQSGSGLALGVGAGAAVAAAGIADLAAKGVRSFVNLTAQVRQFQLVSGASAEDASRMVAVLKIFNVDAEAGARAVFNLSKNIDHHREALTQDNIQIARNSKGQVDTLQTLLNVADAYKAVGGGQKGATIASDAFGRQGLALIPILSQSREQIEGFWKAAEQHGEVFSQDDIEKGKEFQIAMKELDASVGGLERSLGEGLIPALTKTADELTHTIDVTNKLTRPLGGVAGGIQTIINLARDLNPVAKVFNVFAAGTDLWHHRIKEALVDLIPFGNTVRGLFGHHKKAAEAADEQAAALADLTDSLDASASATDAAESALGAYNKTLQGVIDSVLGIPTALDDVDQAFIDLQDNSETATTKAASAQTRLADAIESANRRIRDAEQEVSDAREDLNKQASGDRTDARRRVRDAEERLADAQADKTKAQKENTDDLGGSIKTAKEQAIELDRKMGNVVDKVATEVQKMIAAKRPTSEILAYITSQRDRLGEVGTKLGANKAQLDLYLTALQQVYQTTKDIADLVNSSSGWPVTLGAVAGGIANGASPSGSSGSLLSRLAGGAAAGVTIEQNFYGPTDPAEQQRQAAKAFNTGLRRRG